MKKLYLIVALSLLSACGTTTSEKKETTYQFAYACGAKQANFVSSKPENATLSVDGKTYQINLVPAASGAKYVNSDEKVVFWSTGNEASLEINNVIFPKCIVKSKRVIN